MSVKNELKTITDLNMEQRHTLLYRILTKIGQNVEGSRTDLLYLDRYVNEGFEDMEQENLRLLIRDMFLSARNTGLLIDVSLKLGRGYMLAVSYGGRRYYPYLDQGLPHEHERRIEYQLNDPIGLWEEEQKAAS